MCLVPCLTIDFRQRFGSWNFLGASLDAIWGVGAVFDTAVTHHRLDALFGVHRARRVHVEQAHLAEDGRAYEIIVLVDLRANFQAVAARNAARERIRLLLHLGRDTRAFAEILRS